MSDNDFSANASAALNAAKTILLVDWVDESVPSSLAEAGFTVYSYSPDGYTQVEVEDGKLLFRRLDAAPDSMDLVYVYRPEAEHESIITKHALPSGAKVLWLHPPVVSKATAALAAGKGLIFIEGIDIRDVISSIR